MNTSRSKKAEIPSIRNEPLTNEDLRPSAPTNFDYLGHDVNKMIFEDLIIEDFASIRLVSKGFRKFFDDFNYALCCELIPGFTKSTFSYWNDEDPAKEYLKYRLIVLTRAILSDYKPLRMKYLKSGIGMHLNTDFHLRRNAVKMIRFFETKNFDVCLKLANAFLNLRIVAWGDIYHLLFSKSPENISKAWELGLTTIAREMAFYHQQKFLESIKQETGNLLKVSNARKFILFRFMISTARGQSFDLGRIDKCANQLIKSKKWDLLIDLFDLNRENVPSLHLMQFAKEGNVDGLRALRGLIKYLTSCQCKNLVFLAASNGRLEFLQELDAMGLLKEEHYDNIHVATANDHTECMEFLVNRFGTKYLSVMNEDRQIPIEIAAKSKNPETLRTIIRLSPHQRFDLQRALIQALVWNLPSNAKILIEHSPILIDPISIGLAIDYDQIEFLKYLLENASPKTITVKGFSGHTALHYAAYQDNWARIVPILLDTGLLNVMERNYHGKTPVAILKSVKPSTPNSVLMKIFKLETMKQLADALRIYCNREMADASHRTNREYYFYMPLPPPPPPISPRFSV